MFSRTSRWNSKPDDKNFELGFNKNQCEILHDEIKIKKAFQEATKKAFGL